MPKKSRNKKGRSAANSSTHSSSSVVYFSNLMQIFNSLYENYYAEKLEEPNALMVTGIGQLNNLHINDPNTNAIPAVCCFIVQNTLNRHHFKFLTALKNWGLNVNFEGAVNMMLLSHALKSQKPEYISWIVNDCSIKIPSSGNPMYENSFNFDIEETKILDYIEANLGTPVVDFYLDLIPKHHIEGNSVLHLAAMHNHAELFHKLAASGADINQPNLFGVTPAMLGVAHEDSKIIELLLSQDYGANIDLSILTTARDSLFHYIILGKSVPMFQFAANMLEQQGVSLNELTIRDGFNIIHWAIDNAQCALIFELLKHVDINAPTPDDNHLVVYAFINDEPDIGQHIASVHRIDIEKATFTEDGKNIFQMVIEHDAVTSFNWLIDEDYFNVHTLDNAGRPPLLLASKVDSTLIIDELFESFTLSELLNDVEDDNGMRFAHYLAKHNHFINIEILIECNLLDLDHRDIEGNTVLDITLIHGESHAMLRNECLNYIERDAERKKPKLKLRLSEIKQLHLLLPVYFADEIGERATNLDGENAVHLAYQKYGIDYLLEQQEKYTVDINTRNSQGETILCKLIKQKNLEAIKELIHRCKPDLNNLDNNKSNLLQLACEHNFVELVEWCLKAHSISVTKAPKGGFSALDISIIKRNTIILHMLWEKLSSKQNYIYISLLKRKGGQYLLEFLEEEGLYSFEEDKEEETKVEQKDDSKEPQAENSTNVIQESKVEALTCDEKTLFNAVQNQDHEYFSKLKHYSEYNDLLNTHAELLLIAATSTKNYRLVYNILLIPSLAAYASINDNQILVIAATEGSKDIVEALLRISSVSQSLRDPNHPSKLAAIANGHTAIAELLNEYIDANLEVMQVASQDATDDDITITTTNSESPRPGSSALSMFNTSRSSSSLSSIYTERESISPLDESMPQFVTTPISQHNKQISAPIAKAKTVNSVDILAESISELNINAKPFEKLPRCFSDPDLYKVLQLITKIFKKANLDGYIFGSAQHKLKPGDLDIVVPNSDISLHRKKINYLIELFRENGGTVTSRDKHTGYYGYSHEGRHVIPIDLKVITLDINIYPKSIVEHAYNLDFTRSARYLSVITWIYRVIPGIYANIDIAHNLIQTIINAHMSFEKDPRRIFRAVKQMVDEGDNLSAECLQAIHDIFYGPKNPFVTHISIGKMYYRMEVFLKTERPELYFEMLNNLGIFQKLYECFALHSDYSAAYYRNILEPYQRAFNFRREQEQMQLASQSLYTMYGNCGHPSADEPLMHIRSDRNMRYS